MNDRTFKPATAQVGRRNIIMSGVALSAAALVTGTTLGSGTSTNPSTARKVWLITGAGRGLGLDIAKAALDGGHYVVATGRDPLKVAAAIGEHENLLSIKLDVIRPRIVRRRSQQRSAGSAGSMCWSTMQAISLLASSRNSARIRFATRSRHRCSVR